MSDHDDYNRATTHDAAAQAAADHGAADHGASDHGAPHPDAVAPAGSTDSTGADSTGAGDSVRLAGSLEELSTLDARPLTEHPEVFARIHSELQSALAEIDSY